MKKFFPILVCAATSLFAEKETSFSTYLHSPHFENGTLTTHEGGVVSGEGFRIQAKNITVSQEKNGAVLNASGDVAFLYNSTLIIADEVHFSLSEHRGSATNALAAYGIWLIGSDEIEILPSGSVIAKSPSITPEDTARRLLCARASSAELTSKGMLSAKNLSVQILSIPVFYLPSFQTSLRKNIESPLQYDLLWISGQDIELIMRYKIYGSEQSSAYLRGDVRPSRGFGGAVETFYEGERKSIITKSYVAHDTFYRDDNPNRKRTRYRLQGKYETISPSENTTLLVQYDKISDRNMSQDFPSAAFEFDIAKATDVTLRHTTDQGILGLYFAPRINAFQGFTQKLPSAFYRSIPFDLYEGRFFITTEAIGEYLDFKPASFVATDTPSYSSGRLTNTSTLSALFTPRYFQITPYLGYEALLYTSSPTTGRSQLAASLLYGGEITSPWKKRYPLTLHTITPFLEVTGITTPTTLAQNHYIFGLSDGIDRLTQFEYGIKNVFSFNKSGVFPERLSLRLSLLSFLAQDSFSKGVPKGKFDLDLSLSNATLSQKALWNFQYSVLDMARTVVKWTFNNDAALSLEFQHRSKYYWRKDDFQNYILDVTRNADELLGTTISDGRNLVLTKAQFKVGELWWLKIQSHHGFGRAGQTSYSEFKVDLINQFSTHWKAKISYTQTTLGPVFNMQFKLVH